MSITVFSNSVGGYNKRQVDEYIADMNRAFVKAKRDYEKKIEILEAENARLRQELEGKPTVMLPPKGQPPIAAVSDVEATEKSRRYDEISRQVGEILMNANAEASRTVREADEKVRTALTCTMSTLRGEVGSLITKLNELLREAEEKLAVEDEGPDKKEDGEGA